MFNIKAYKDSDFEMVKSWWDKQGEVAPNKDMLPLDSTYVLYVKDSPALCVSLYLTNIKEYCYVECFVGNPECKGNSRKEATLLLLEYISFVAKQKGYKKLVCLAHKKELARYYQQIGFNTTLTDVTTFCKIL